MTDDEFETMKRDAANWLRRIGTWIHDWPCNRGLHDYGPWRPGTAWWWRNCKHCGRSDMTGQPERREDIDMTAYEAYRKRHAALQEPPA